MPLEDSPNPARKRLFPTQAFLGMVQRARAQRNKTVDQPGQKISFTQTLTDAVGRFSRFAWRHPKLGLAYLGSSLIPGGFVFKGTLPGPATRREEGYLRGAFRNAWRNPLSNVRLWWGSRRAAPAERPSAPAASSTSRAIPTKQAGLFARFNRDSRRERLPPPVIARPFALRARKSFAESAGAPQNKFAGNFVQSIVARLGRRARQPVRLVGGGTQFPNTPPVRPAGKRRLAA